MNAKLLRQVSWIGDRYVVGKTRGIILRFGGLGSQGMQNDQNSHAELTWAAAGGLIVTPYHNPWAWMNDATVNFVDEVVDATIAALRLPKNIPIISTGGSMGGHGALAYSFKSRQRITACYALCPVCDLVFHYSERADLPRTMHSAFGSYGEIRTKLIASSPLHQVARLPDIPYLFIHGKKDGSVSKKAHSDKLVKALRQKGRHVQYVEAKEMAHCGPVFWPEINAINTFIRQALG